MRFFLAAFAAAACFAQTDPGRRTYESSCGRCHGGDATGGEAGPNITNQIAARNDEDLQRFLREGRAATGTRYLGEAVGNTIAVRTACSERTGD